MKRWTILLLTFLFLLTVAGCSRNVAPPKTPVTFYYPAAQTTYDGRTPILHQQIREGAGYTEDMAKLLNLYFSGPADETLRSPFPAHVTVTRFSTTSNTVSLELSSEFAQLGGIDLTLACACIANTVFDLTQLDRVQIFAADSLLDGQASITIDRNDLCFVDIPVPTEVPTDTSTAP